MLSIAGRRSEIQAAGEEAPSAFSPPPADSEGFPVSD
jgi:hypothetical protein